MLNYDVSILYIFQYLHNEKKYFDIMSFEISLLQI